MTRLPSLQILLSFEASVRLRSFTRAAEELALTQGAVSQHVRALEARLDTRLFHRERLGVVPTGEAQHLALQVRQGLGVLERAFRLEPRQAKSPDPVRLRLSTLPSVARRWLAPRLQNFQRQHSNIDVQVEMGADLASLDHHDGVDVALRYGPGNWPSLRCDKLAEESIFPVASPTYLGPGPADDVDLSAYTLLRHPAQPWELWFQAAGLPLAESAEGPQFDDFDAYIDAAVAGQGVALVRRALVSEELENGQLVCPWKIETRDVHAYYLVWRPDSAKLAAIEALRLWLLSEFA
ncbi:hypothetical protein L861_06520 [Litchfieldella anticariensis FP35 = DSM 16096]|uniref:HTH lysR-type domain-containing protein n=1 Tax=Litchfieldella anticariensis (strain DSM 16096 / CECT 5854 / CIP 108499 / LMG 22089 / FP35) TaxID=1121939 RepID=S2KJL7_LITA3|nr:LysR substrate-binding domain-containing protein [Halomonas anticariensis]EPC00588.1 hypothetical protein L861_06520 [Halomonas anticariensis FP35 = DSM 16096]